MFDAVRPARRRARKYYRLAWRVQQARRTSPTRRALDCVFKAVADPEKVVWIRPGDITHKVVYDLSLFGNDVLPGDWDLKLRSLDVAAEAPGNRAALPRRCGVGRDESVHRQVRRGARLRGGHPGIGGSRCARTPLRGALR